VSFDSVNLLIINVYMPYEDGDNHIDEFVSELTIIEELFCAHSDCHVVLLLLCYYIMLCIICFASLSASVMTPSFQ